MPSTWTWRPTYLNSIWQLQAARPQHPRFSAARQRVLLPQQALLLACGTHAAACAVHHPPNALLLLRVLTL